MKLSSLLALLLVAPAFAYGGGSTGNGGQSVLCYGAGGHLVSAEAFDLYEGRALFAYTYPSREKEGALEAALRIARRVDVAFPERPGARLEQRVREIAKSISSAEDRGGMDLTRDIRPFYLAHHCTLVQTIIFRSDGQLDVNFEAWTSLDETSRAALYLHEAIYWQLRELAGEQDALRARRIAAFLLSNGDPADAPVAFTSYDPTPAYCSRRYGGIRYGGGPRLFLFLDPAGRPGALFPMPEAADGYDHVLFQGRVTGASLARSAGFGPSASAELAGTRYALSLSEGSALARFTMRTPGGEERSIPLYCQLFAGLLP